MASLTLSKIVKRYGKTEVIHGVDLDVADGEFVVLVGPSGCGKSTLLRIIAGLEEVNEGEVYIGGQLMNEVDPAKRGVAMVFQSYALYPHMSVADNMGFGLRMAGRPKQEIRERVARAAEILHLTPYLKRRPKELSGGQKQGSPSAEPSSGNQRSSFSTNRCPIWMLSCGCRCGSSFPSCIAGFRLPWSTSLMTRSKP